MATVRVLTVSSEVMGLVDDLTWRGLIHQTTAENLREALAAPVTMYVGFDPSAASLHVGSLMPLTGMAHFRRHGHRVIALVGGATGMIGDPSGKTSERKLLSADEVAANARKLEAQMRAFFAADDGPEVLFANNLDWFGSMGLLAFLRDVGKHFSVNQMIARDSVKARFEAREAGISFTEFSYMLLQGYDFLELARRHGCTFQCGASDQWGNIVSGVDLVRRIDGKAVQGLTLPLVTDSQGRKYGKTEKGAVYLDPALTSPYDFYQFWFNTADADVGRFLRWLTFLPREEIDALEASPGAERHAQRALAAELTRRVHGEAALREAIDAAGALFGGGSSADALSQAPGITVPASRFDGDGALVVDLLVEVGACNSKSDARRQLAAGAISINDRSLGPVGPEVRARASDLVDGKLLVLQKGKKHKFVVRVG